MSDFEIAGAGGAEPFTATLRPCPFCGGEPRLEQSPWLDDGFRITCGNDACGVVPRTDYLLSCYAVELRTLWNRRPGLLAPADPPG